MSPHDAGIVLGPEEGATDGDLAISAPYGDVQPFVEVGLFAAISPLFDQEAEGGSHRADVDTIDLLATGVLEKAGEDGA